MHAHFIPPTYAELVSKRGLPLRRPPWRLSELEATMDRYRIDAAVVSVPPLGRPVRDRALALELARIVNEALAGIVAGAPRRFAALGALPLPSVDAAISELGHILDVLRLDGVMLETNVDGTYLGDPAWDPLFDELDRRGAYVLVHPTVPPGYGGPNTLPPWVVEYPAETTRAIAELLFSGTLERCPNLRVQVPHLGGALPFLAERIGSLVVREPAYRQALADTPIEYLRRLYYDSGLANHRIPIETAVATVGSERLVFGTDWPYAALPADGGDPAPELDALGEPLRARIEHEHPARLVARWSRTEAL